MNGQNVSQVRKTFGRSAAPVIEELEARGATIVSVQQLAAIKGVAAESPVVRGLVRRLKASGWLVPLARQGMYEFVPLRAGPYPSNDELRELEALARGPKPPRFQLALGSAAFLRGYAETAPVQSYVVLDKRATTRPRRLRDRFHVIRTDANRLFGAEPLNADSRVPVSTASRLFIDAALFWDRAGDLRSGDHWLAAATKDVNAKRTAGWATQLGPGVVSRVGFLAERFGARELAELLAPSVERRAVASFGPRGQGEYDAKWHVYDPIGIGRSK